ncbi:hypothetical protein MMC11_006473 [Xylographa trunciseda]|nr:hypothetical protein [Xylographa trunciseda]
MDNITVEILNPVYPDEPVCTMSLLDFLHMMPTTSTHPCSKPFDREAAEYLVERYRNAVPLVFIMSALYKRDYILPGKEMVRSLLAANGMHENDQVIMGPNGFVAHKGKVWGDIVVPEESLQPVSLQVGKEGVKEAEMEGKGDAG